MTSIVAIRCRDGVVVGADSSATFGDGALVRTIEQPTNRKIEIIGNKVIVAGTGYVGHSQRFVNVLRELYGRNEFEGKSPMAIANLVSRRGLEEFARTYVRVLDYSAFVAYESSGAPVLCELPRGLMTNDGPTAFQPELKDPEDLWFASSGIGQPITDSFLALFRDIFWENGPPNVRGGIFTSLWALRHACDVNTGGIKEPINIAILSKDKKGKFVARMLDEYEISEHENVVTAATQHMQKFLDVLEGKSGAQEVPKPK